MSEGPARVLEILRDAGRGPCSGEALSEALGVSRAQVWKHVEALRRRDYGIEGEPGGGYRLTSVPDRLYPEELLAGHGAHEHEQQHHEREGGKVAKRRKHLPKTRPSCGDWCTACAERRVGVPNPQHEEGAYRLPAACNTKQRHFPIPTHLHQ